MGLAKDDVCPLLIITDKDQKYRQLTEVVVKTQINELTNVSMSQLFTSLSDGRAANCYSLYSLIVPDDLCDKSSALEVKT